jgi:hypothetical protein
MRRFAICCAVVLIGCDKPKDQPAADAAADTPAPAAPAAPAPISLADVAGKWAVRTMNETGDSTLVSYEMVASADSSAWNFTFPGRKPIPMRIIAVAGDSIVSESGPFESALRKGVQVRVTQVLRLQDSKLMGTTTARYATKSADSIAHLRLEGTRAP